MSHSIPPNDAPPIPRRVLFVDDEPRVLDGLRRLLRPMRETWDMAFAESAADALASLAERPADVVVTDMRMPGMDGATLLHHVAERWPATVRIVLSGQTDQETAVRTIRVAHQFLVKPCDAAVLRHSVERACRLTELLSDAGLRELTGGVDALPSAPAVLAALERVLVSPDATIGAATAVIERDPGLVAKLLQLANSSFFGLGRRVSRADQAIGCMGLTVLRGLVLTHEIESAFGHGVSLSLEAEQAHALLVGQVARRLTPDRAAADDAFTAGLLHDVGKLVLASRAPAYYASVTADALARAVPLHEAEREARGVTHAEVGAYLLGLWGLPYTVIEAVAHHHAPSRAPNVGLDLLAVVHAANALVRASSGESPVLDPKVARDIAAGGVLLAWQAAARAVVARVGEAAA